jgi:integrase
LLGALSKKMLNDVTRDVVMQIAEVKRKECSPSRANRFLALIRAILRRAEREWEWLDKAPTVRMYKEPKRRVRWITPAEVSTLLKELPEHQREAMTFALATGLRQANVVKLEWSQVDLERNTAWILGDRQKVETISTSR